MATDDFPPENPSDKAPKATEGVKISTPGGGVKTPIKNYGDVGDPAKKADNVPDILKEGKSENVLKENETWVQNTERRLNKPGPQNPASANGYIKDYNDIGDPSRKERTASEIVNAKKSKLVKRDDEDFRSLVQRVRNESEKPPDADPPDNPSGAQFIQKLNELNIQSETKPKEQQDKAKTGKNIDLSK